MLNKKFILYALTATVDGLQFSHPLGGRKSQFKIKYLAKEAG
jgi:hypothetical protein